MGKRKEKQKGVKPEAGFPQQGQFPAGAAPLSELNLSDGFLFGEGKLCYTFENTCAELPGLKLSDGAVKIFLNTEGKEESERDSLLAEFLRYVSDHNAPAESPEVKQIQKRVEEVKRNEETEARYMTSITYAREVYEDGRMEGKAEGKADMIFEFLDELGDIPEELRTEVSRESDMGRLSRWVKLAARSGSIKEFEEKMYAG